MDEADHLDTLLQRLADGTASETDRQTLREHIAAGHLNLATGPRAVALGGSVTDAVIVTGDGNIVFRGGDATALRQAFRALYPTRLHQLPADLPDFTGRDAEEDKLLRMFQGGSGQAAISALVGMGGVGKTALAVHVAHKLARYFPEAQIVVDLAGTSDTPLTPPAAMGRVIHAFEPQARLPESPGEVEALYRSLLAGRRALLLLDNAANAAQVKDLLPSPPAAAIITSRRQITLPGLNSLGLGVLPPDAAGELLRAILGERQAADREIAALAERCGCLPLALRAAGSFLAAYPDWQVDEYLEELAKEKERLRRLQHEDFEVEAAMGLSAAQLVRENPEWAGRWQLLAVFPSSFDRAGAAAVWEEGEEEARDLLSELLHRSLLLYDKDTGRYRLHDLMSLVARNAYGYGGAAADAAMDARRLSLSEARHAIYYGKILRQANELCLQGGEALGQGLQLFDREWGNIQAGQGRAAIRAGENEAAARLCNAYPDVGSYLLSLRLPPRERIAWLQAALAASRRLQDREAEANHMGQLGISYCHMGEYRRAIAYTEKALVIFQEICDRKAEGNALGNLGLAYDCLGEYRLAIEYHQQALAVFREMSDRRGEGNALGGLGNAYFSLGEYPRAIGFHEQHLAIAHEIGDRLGEGQELGNLGNVYAYVGEYHRAIDFYKKALISAQEIRDRQGEGNILGNLGNVYFSLGEYRLAIKFFEQTMKIAREIGHRPGEGTAQWNLSLALNKLGARDKAIIHAQQALEIFEQIEHPDTDMVRRQLAAWR